MKYKILYMFLGFVIVFPFTIKTGAEEKLKNNYEKERLLFDFKSADQLEPWRVVNDGVMGGLSQSKLIPGDRQTVVFEGTVRLENNGGFASTRTLPREYDLKGYNGILIRVKGDGKKYQFRLRTNDRFDGASYRYQFATEANTWMVIDIPFDQFVPVFRGRILKGVGPIVPSEIQQLGFLISNKRLENFQLEIDWIKAYK